MKKTKFLISFTFLAFQFSHSQTLTFKYDSGGNQVVRKYCDGCTHVAKSSAIKNSSIAEVPKKQSEIKIYPNPTRDKVTLIWSEETDLLIQKIEYVAYNFTQIRPLEFKRGEMKAMIDLSKEPIGMYVVVFHLTNGEKLTYKILKN
ncbi:T9SS type A sorting domain-containing protein [Chryseobacterium sp. Marseille-Q3244]|uniref:T9SS type A sorting domain-containing protein n=1 Tax=Chryseobacterium sp. Marseille-Q3244 TaxID=2758092 RepID=UPI002024B0E9|nr:T9SS type A sorting domain-containing protein [Chryseobacterium sp. Marseille-Q3244]